MELLILVPIVVLLIIVVLIYYVFFNDLKNRYDDLENEKVDLYKEIFKIRKELHEKDIRLNNKINDLKILNDDIFKNSNITQEFKLVSYEDLTDEFKQKYFK